MFWNLRELSVAVGDGTVDVVRFGKGTTPLVILPGLSLRDVRGAGVPLALMYRLFARDFCVYVLDKNSEIAEGCSVLTLADDTAAAMEALGITDACVFGVSLGGMMAQALAIRYPHLVKKLVLGVTACRVNDTMRAVVEGWIALAAKGDFGGIVRDMAVVLYSAPYVRRYGWMFPLLAFAAKPKNEERFLRLAKACLTCDTCADLKHITCPTLVLGGAEDKIVTGEASRELARELGCELYLYDGLGHAAYEEAGDFNARIYRFLRGDVEECSVLKRKSSL